MEANKVDEKKFFFSHLVCKANYQERKKTPWLDEAFICLTETVEDRG